MCSVTDSFLDAPSDVFLYIFKDLVFNSLPLIRETDEAVLQSTTVCVGKIDGRYISIDPSRSLGGSTCETKQSFECLFLGDRVVHRRLLLVSSVPFTKLRTFSVDVLKLLMLSGQIAYYKLETCSLFCVRHEATAYCEMGSGQPVVITRPEQSRFMVLFADISPLSACFRLTGVQQVLIIDGLDMMNSISLDLPSGLLGIHVQWVPSFDKARALLLKSKFSVIWTHVKLGSDFEEDEFLAKTIGVIPLSERPVIISSLNGTESKFYSDATCEDPRDVGLVRRTLLQAVIAFHNRNLLEVGLGATSF